MSLNRKDCLSFEPLATTLRDRLEALCEDEGASASSLCDAIFRIGPKHKVFRVVSALFAIQSTPLCELLTDGDERDVSISDVTPDCFCFLRRYFYSLDPALSVENVSDILYAANKLQIEALQIAAKRFISEITGIDDIVLILANLHRLGLHEQCDHTISEKKVFYDAAKAFESENFNLLPTELMIRLLKWATFGRTERLTEEVVFQKCVLWAKYKAQINRINQGKGPSSSSDDDDGDASGEEFKAQGGDGDEAAVGLGAEHFYRARSRNNGRPSTNWKDLIQPLLPEIRFPIMEGPYFADKVVNLGLLTAVHCTEIMQSYFIELPSNRKPTYSSKRRY